MGRDGAAWGRFPLGAGRTRGGQRARLGWSQGVLAGCEGNGGKNKTHNKTPPEIAAAKLCRIAP